MSSEVGSGHVSVFPVMTGFKARVAKETKAAGAAGAKTFEGGFKGAGTNAGRTLGKGLKSALSSSAGDLGASAMKGLNREVAAAAAALSKTRLKQQDEAGKVRVAEAKLQEAIAKSGATSSQAIAAEERLASARRSHKAATDAVTAATTRLRGAQDAVKKATSASATTSRSAWARVGDSAVSGLQRMVSGAASIGRRAGAALGAALRSTATAGVTAAAAGIGIALGKGFGRLTAIDTAQAKLRGFGKDAAEIKAIMADATASVKGTAFGLGEAATVAGAAVAAGIKPGRDLQAHLKAVANNASAAGLSMEDMGSIFNKAATQANGVQNDVIGQLADKGIPIYQELAKVLGVTAGEVFKMASEGKVDFETFSKAATIAAGTVADEMGKTVPGATKNFFAAMGRIGANALGGLGEGSFYSKIGPLIQSVTKAMGPLEARAEKLGQAWNRLAGPVMDRLTGFFTGLADGSSNAAAKLKEFLPILAPLGGAFAALGAGGLAGLLARLGPLGALLPGLGKGLALLGGPLGIAAAAFGAFALSGGDVSGLVSGVTRIVDQVVAALPKLIDGVVGAVPGIVNGILGAVPQLVTAAVGIIEALVDGLVTAVPLLIDGALALIDGLITAIISNLPMLITAALQLVTALLNGIITALPLIIQGGIDLLMALIRGIIDSLPLLIEAALSLVMGLLQAIIDNLPLIIDAGIQLLLSLITGLVEALPMLITAAIELVLQLLAGLLQMLPQLIEAGITLVVALITGLIEAIPQIVEMLPQIIDAIWNGLIEVDWLGLGAQIIQGIIDGFFSMVGSLGDAVGDIVGTITDFFPHSPAKRGPLAAAGWRRLKSSGAATMEQFTAGAADQSSSFGDALVGMASSASQRAQAAMTSASATVDASSTVRAARGAPAGGGSKTIQQTNHFDKTDPKEAAELANQQLDAMVRGA